MSTEPTTTRTPFDALQALAAFARTAPGALHEHVSEALKVADAQRGDRALDSWGRPAKAASEEALDAIAAICGCPEWGYPGQVVRDVQRLHDGVQRFGRRSDSLPVFPTVSADDQVELYEWVRRTFGDEAATSTTERISRLLEEAIELAQAEGFTRAQLAPIVARVYGRPAGHRLEEAGAVGVTLLAYCAAVGIDGARAIREELARIYAIAPDVWAKRHARKVREGIAIGRPGLEACACAQADCPTCSPAPLSAEAPK